MLREKTKEIAEHINSLC